jgi:hypothetical protein
MDAEFFLAQAGIAAWPCATEALTVARRRVLASLHPDRMGERSAPLFQRAVRGHAELARRLAALTPPGAVATTAPTSAAAPRAAANAAPPPRASAMGEWPLASDAR